MADSNPTSLTSLLDGLDAINQLISQMENPDPVSGSSLTNSPRMPPEDSILVEENDDVEVEDSDTPDPYCDIPVKPHLSKA